MVRCPLALVAPVLVITACGPRVTVASDRRPPVSPAPESDNPYAAEYAVYAAVLADLKYEVRVAEKTHQALPCDSEVMSLCDSGKLSDEYRDALRDYIAKGAASIVLPRPPTPARPVARWQVPSGEASRCSPMPRVGLSRVGFSTDSTHAVVSYSESAGPGPFPGCGYVGGRLLLLRRDDAGEWRVAAVVADWIT